jgi:hypothetical protein
MLWCMCVCEILLANCTIQNNNQNDKAEQKLEQKEGQNAKVAKMLYNFVLKRFLCIYN